MPEQLGPGSYNGIQLTIDMLIMEMSDLELQRIQNSETQQLLHKHSSVEVADLQQSYGQEIQYIRNEMRDLDDKTAGSEYFDLMSELEELEQERDSKIKKIETEDEDREKKLEVQNTSLETRYEAAKADKEGLEQAQESNIKGQ